MFRFVFLSVSMMLASAAAADHTYHCKVKENGRSGWVPEELIIYHDNAKGYAIAADPITLHFNDGKPVEAKVSVDNSSRITFVWSVEVKDRQNTRATMQFRATWVKAEKKLNVFVQAVGNYENKYTGHGTCVVK